MIDKQLTLGELEYKIREIQEYYGLPDNTPVTVRINWGREYLHIYGEINILYHKKFLVDELIDKFKEES